MKRLLSASASIAALATVAPISAVAQNLQDEIIVTVTRSEQSVQEVPIAISAYSGDLLDKSGVSDIRELAILSPSLVVVATQSEAVGVNARIRGVGTVGDNPGLQSSVGVFIDEVYRSRNSVALGDLGEISAIEVARGPQGTLFGRNSSAGAIVVRTKQPEYEFGGYAEYTRSNFSGNRVEGAVTGPLAEGVLAARINGFYEDRDGFLTEVVSGQEFNDRNQFGLRGQLLYEPNDAWSFRLIGDYSERDEICCAAVNIVNGPTGAIVDALSAPTGDLAIRSSDPFDREVGVTPGRSYTQDVEDWGISLQSSWDTEFANIVSVTAYREFDIARSQDIDFTRADIVFRPEDGFVNGFDTLTQELRANGSSGNIDWLVGVYYSNEDVSLNDRIALGPQYEFYTDALVNAALAGSPLAGLFSWSALTGLPAGTVFAGAAENDNFLSDSRSIAVYSNNTINLSDRARITLGGRYTNEDNDFSGTLTSTNNGCLAVVGAFGATAAGAPPNALAAAIVPSAAGPTVATLACILNITPFADTTISDSREENEFTWDAKFSYDLSDNVTFYGGAARGYKAGGFNFDRAGGPLAVAGLLTTGIPTVSTGSDLEFEEETVINYEGGFKTTIMGGNATFNITGFFAEYDDYQLNTFNGISFVVENIDKVKSHGVEVDFLARPTDQLFFQGGITYANTKYGDNITSTLTNGTNGERLNGKQITLAPKWSATGAMTYTEQLMDTGYDIFMNWNFRYSSDYNTGSDLDPNKVQDDFVMANASLGIVSQDTGFELEGFVRNLTNADVMQVAFNAPFQAGSFDAFLTNPRTYGITARFRF